MASVEINSKDINEFAKRLKAFDDKKFRAAAMKRLKGTAAEAVVAAKSAAMSIPSKGAPSYKEPELRPLLANAVVPAFRSGGKSVGISVRVSRARLPANRQGAEKTLEFGGRVPVFARQAQGPKRKRAGRVQSANATWVQQPAHPWFRKSMDPFKEKVVLAFTKVMKDISRDIGFK